VVVDLDPDRVVRREHDDADVRARVEDRVGDQLAREEDDRVGDVLTVPRPQRLENEASSFPRARRLGYECRPRFDRQLLGLPTPYNPSSWSPKRLAGNPDLDGRPARDPPGRGAPDL
jgi:hypothetical protein